MLMGKCLPAWELQAWKQSGSQGDMWREQVDLEVQLDTWESEIAWRNHPGWQNKKLRNSLSPEKVKNGLRLVKSQLDKWEFMWEIKSYLKKIEKDKKKKKNFIIY